MNDIHPLFTQFKADFPGVQEKLAALGREVHLHEGPLDDKTRCLLKVVIAGATGHTKALETHLARARETGLTDDEIKHALLLLIPTCGFPRFMEAYDTLQSMG